jgi:hypothetical protein
MPCIQRSRTNSLNTQVTTISSSFAGQQVTEAVEEDIFHGRVFRRLYTSRPDGSLISSWKQISYAATESLTKSISSSWLSSMEATFARSAPTRTRQRSSVPPIRVSPERVVKQQREDSRKDHSAYRERPNTQRPRYCQTRMDRRKHTEEKDVAVDLGVSQGHVWRIYC